jgi:hypothetical protein
MDNKEFDKDIVENVPYIAYSNHPPKYVFEGMIWEREKDFMRFTADFKAEVWRSKTRHDYFVAMPEKSILFIQSGTKWIKTKTLPKK